MLISPTAPKNVFSTYDVNAEIAIINDKDEVIDSYCTFPLQYEKGMLNMNKEECIFTDVYDTGNLRCSMFAVDIKHHTKRCTGIVDVPISRLEENVLVSRF